jgi:hypothetical protein
MKKILSLSVAIVAISIFYTTPAQTFAQSKSYEDFSLGSGTASWYLEVFNDFQCPTVHDFIEYFLLRTFENM